MVVAESLLGDFGSRGAGTSVMLGLRRQDGLQLCKQPQSWLVDAEIVRSRAVAQVAGLMFSCLQQLCFILIGQGPNNPMSGLHGTSHVAMARGTSQAI